MNDLQNTISYAGLSENQAKVYTGLLELGEASIADIGRYSDLQRPSTYHTIEQLDMVGLVSKVKKGKRTVYSAVHPRRLVQLAKFRAQQVEDTFPKLLGMYEQVGEKPKVQMFEGMNAVREIYKDAFERLRAGEELLIFTNIGRVIEKFPEVPQEFKKIVGSIAYRSEVRELVFGDASGRAYAESIKNKIGKSYQIKISDGQHAFGDNEQFIFKDKIIYFSLQKHIFVVVIENEDLATTHRAMFDMAWEQAREI
jgi:sugar-specific transcriptional regulator TrmB